MIITSFEDFAVLVDSVDLDSVVDEFVGVHFCFVKLKLKLLNSPTMEFKKGLIDKHLQGQLKTVFQQFDVDKKDALTFTQFQEYTYSIGMNFINKEYEPEMLKDLFEDNKAKRVTFNAFFTFLETNSIHEYTPE